MPWHLLLTRVALDKVWNNMEIVTGMSWEAEMSARLRSGRSKLV